MNNGLLNLASDILSFIIEIKIESQLFINATFLIPSTKQNAALLTQNETFSLISKLDLYVWVYFPLWQKAPIFTSPSGTITAVICHMLILLFMHRCMSTYLFLPALKEQLGISCRTLFGLEASQMSFLFLLVYVAAAGGLLPLLESSPGSAQELKVKVTCLFHPRLDQNKV